MTDKEKVKYLVEFISNRIDRFNYRCGKYDDKEQIISERELDFMIDHIEKSEKILKYVGEKYQSDTLDRTVQFFMEQSDD